MAFVENGLALSAFLVFHQLVNSEHGRYDFGFTAQIGDDFFWVEMIFLMIKVTVLNWCVFCFFTKPEKIFFKQMVGAGNFYRRCFRSVCFKIVGHDENDICVGFLRVVSFQNRLPQLAERF
ncbi:MAG: hypothetical protein COU29_03315 [Candidatus Magasanikbacteria bacterium CG10_big_fil_rev_8_21_14_0_10_36_32]|uniref:Uncharacterized protein n=1 Tax=Candidatus Magasanikbacteria bacterium CG10_big_fil_rev_8_21_14_0_10_36_32 TaxID=1974646 RepID=A0A2M6W692_9BACT|nr:MAG: hypothetical protein COU29_03315 [Candidatus Magasanikbacteria bacterium CG10_big_fil_rev_8_21_14_0_10_36_32]